MFMDTKYRYQILQQIYNGLVIVICDVPSSRRAWGISSFNYKTHMCNQCKITMVEIKTVKGYDIDSMLS